jgi:hypothetical protein
MDHVVGEFTHGSFHGWASDPMTLDEARAFVANPPDVWKPRPQDCLRIFELVEVDDWCRS